MSRIMQAWLLPCILATLVHTALGQQLRVGTFDIDASPPVGSPLAYDPTREITEPLSCRGLVIIFDAQPVVLCAIDWLGVANEANLAFRQAIAESVGTTPDRVVVHALHQHDAPRCDFSAAEILAGWGQAEAHYDLPFAHSVIARASQAARRAKETAAECTSISFGQAQVQDVASNRRMLGPDGMVHTTRYTACADPAIRALPTGVIDPLLKLLTFNSQDGPLAALTFYATHPQSYYRTGGANPDFPGMARNQRQLETGVFHLHFNGAGGNIGAGKFNDGSHENRMILAQRVASAMQLAWNGRQPLTAAEVSWSQAEALVPVADHLNEAALMEQLQDPSTTFAAHCNAAEQLAFLRRSNDARQVRMSLSTLRLGEAQLLFMPGELFVEYQLAAQAMKPELKVMLAAYGDYGTAYIGTRAAYAQGGYEVSQRATNVSPDVEQSLVQAMRVLLQPTDARVLPSDFTDRSGSLP